MFGSICRLPCGSLGCIVMLALGGCEVIAPLDDLAPAIADTRARGDRDGGADRDEPDDFSADGGRDGCAPPSGAECDPVAQCGCADNESCQYGAGGTPTCYAVVARGNAREGERCDTPNACAEGLSCPATGLCARPCTRDAECVDQSCQRIAGQASALETEGSVCVLACEPVTADGCAPGSTCVPTRDVLIQPTAICHRIQPEVSDARPVPAGEQCTFHSDCARGLGCLATNTDLSGVCTLWCRADFDCPAQQPSCQLLDWYYAESGDPVGQCVATQSGTTSDLCSVPQDPPAWSEGPVWSIDQLSDCLVTCGADLRSTCVVEMCQDGADFVACMNISLEACAGSLQGSCRPEYAGAVCCQRQNCGGAADAQTCNQMFCAEQISAWSMCAGNDEACAEAATATCVQ
jgi:hypothetical protein